MPSQKPETVFNVDQLFTQINSSFTSAAMELHKTFQSEDWQDFPFVYHMPKMSMAVKLVLSHSDGKVKGLFKKTSTERGEELMSNIQIDVVAVPRAALTQGAGVDSESDGVE